MDASSVQIRLWMEAKALFDLKDLQVEDQFRVGWDTRKSLLAVCEMRRDSDTTFSANSHTLDANFPALDDLSLTELESKGFALLVG